MVKVVVNYLISEGAGGSIGLRPVVGASGEALLWVFLEASRARGGRGEVEKDLFREKNDYFYAKEGLVWSVLKVGEYNILTSLDIA